MALSQLVVKNIWKNIKQYYLYFFALIFSVTLYFSFVSLQDYPQVRQTLSNSQLSFGAFEAVAYVLYGIVLLYVLYANHLFMKRRSKELGLYQLLGMTKRFIIRMLLIENIVLFVASIFIGIGIGSLATRSFMMLLLKVMGLKVVVSLDFSLLALQKTFVLFGLLLVAIVCQLIVLIQKSTLLDLFQAAQKAKYRAQGFQLWESLLGILGLVFTGYGYYQSTQFLVATNISELILNMVFILLWTFFGTFLIFRFFVSAIANGIRIKGDGYLSLTKVVALTPLIHHMKGNAKSLTLIAILTAFSLVLTTFAYISYYSVEQDAFYYAPADFVADRQHGEQFIKRLTEEGIAYKKEVFNTLFTSIPPEQFFKGKNILQIFKNVDESYKINAIPLSDYQQLEPAVTLQQGEAILALHKNTVARVSGVRRYEEWTLLDVNPIENIRIVGESRHYFIANSNSGRPVLILEDALFNKILQQLERSATVQHYVSLADQQDYEKAQKLYEETIVAGEHRRWSYEETYQRLLTSRGMTIFITAFLGCVFLLVTGSIIYFKQMSEADEEQPAYSVLKKIGFSQDELLRGVLFKQFFNFSVPLIISLIHSFFAVRAGWFFFGSKPVIPMLIMMFIYLFIYSFFAMLSFRYYKQVITNV